MTFEEWHKIGMDSGWCSPTVCYTHEGLPMSAEEDNEFGEGFDPCVHILRLYEDNETQAAVEGNTVFNSRNTTY